VCLMDNPGITDVQVKAVIKNAQDENPVSDVTSTGVKELPLAPLPRAGFRLAKFILFIIAGYIAFLLLLFIFSSFDAAGSISSLAGKNTSDSSFSQKVELFKMMQEEKKSYRDYMMQMSQMILLNLLLPVLSAILGYIFGSKEEAASRRVSE
jgi:hypothetical protein